ncbi:hypothetical protein KORDIASMS9_04597 [Kordia sp. SMS9]|uniref:hypothetical protein n=1 Tax=Kordia sp. SMS9 TaxID=2282170 RepID=UPI000E0D3198|nr:hypothetical protein [Kordia sp. SMS9]AXG72326.1 hypothetical protein KORDIASMS9_04597 [Kordia sp. SMS9]
MKKRNFKTLQLNKNSISFLNANALNGGAVRGSTLPSSIDQPCPISQHDFFCDSTGPFPSDVNTMCIEVCAGNTLDDGCGSIGACPDSYWC